MKLNVKYSGWRWLTFFLIILPVLLFSYFFLVPRYWTGPTKTVLTLPQPLADHLRQKNAVLHETLTAWVMSHSSRISLRTAREIVTEAIKTNKPILILALISAESEFTPTAVSNKSAIGLTQVMYSVHGQTLLKANIIKDKRDLFDIGPNIQAGNLILDTYLSQSNGDVPKAMERYLGGRDGAYLHKILVNLGNLYVLTQSNGSTK